MTVWTKARITMYRELLRARKAWCRAFGTPAPDEYDYHECIDHGGEG